MRVLSVLSDIEMTRRVANFGRASRPGSPYQLIFPTSLVEGASQHLQANGVCGDEQLVLWGGYPTPAGVVIASLLMPETDASWGSVRVLTPEQPTIANWLRERGQLLVVEAHTHGSGPRATEMSDEDRRHPAGRQDGFLTIIVPDYARRGLEFEQSGVWACQALSWERLSAQQVQDRFHIVDDEEARRALA